VKDASFKGAADYERCSKDAEAKIEALKKDLNL
jgi:phosphoglucomutase